MTTKNTTSKETTDDSKDPRKQWTNAFVRLTEFLVEDYKDSVQVISEFELFRKPIKVDVLIIKRDENVVINNAVMRFFKLHNIVEFKSPKDNFNIEDFDKTLGYFHIYLSKERDSKKPPLTFNEVAITIVSVKKPHKTLEILRDERNYKIVETETSGIYYIINGGTTPAIQLVISSELPNSDDDPSLLWIRSFRDNLTTEEAIEATKKAKSKDYNDPVWDVLDFLLSANSNIKKEVKEMSTAYERVWQTLAGDKIASAAAEAREQHAMDMARKMIAKNRPVDEIVEFTGLDLNTVLHLQGE